MTVYGINYSEQIVSSIPPVASSTNAGMIVMPPISTNYYDLNGMMRQMAFVCLKDEIRNADNLLGKKSDFETEKYERQYLQEIPPKQNCIVM
jgi:hypothetical protein